MTIPKNFEEEILIMLKPKIKSVLKQTPAHHRDDLEQELFLLIIKKMKSGFSEPPRFFDLIRDSS